MRQLQGLLPLQGFEEWSWALRRRGPTHTCIACECTITQVLIEVEACLCRVVPTRLARLERGMRLYEAGIRRKAEVQS